MQVTTRQVEIGELWVDSSEKFSLAQYQTIKAYRGGVVRGVVRYLPLSGQDPAVGIDSNEMLACLSVGLSLMLVQFCRTSGITPAAGMLDGETMGARALTLGYPCAASFTAGAGPACLWGDFAPTSASLMSSFGNAWFSGTIAAHVASSSGGGYNEPGVPSDFNLYTGYQFHRYWRDAAEVPNVPTRGYQFAQLWPGNRLIAPGLVVDFDVASSDYRGSYPVCCVAA